MKIKFILLISLITFLTGFMLLTDPNSISLHFLLVPFLVITIVVFLLFKYAIEFVVKTNRSRATLMAAVAAIVGVNFLLLRSVDQLSLQDAYISVAITLLLAFYINKFQLKA